MSVSRDFIDPCSPRRPRHRHCVGQDADSPPWAEWPKPPRSVPEQCLVFGFHISSPVQGVDILVQDILIQDGCGFLTAAARHSRRRWRRDQRAPTPAIPEKPIWPASAVEPRSRFGNSNPKPALESGRSPVSLGTRRARQNMLRGFANFASGTPARGTRPAPLHRSRSTFLTSCLPASLIIRSPLRDCRGPVVRLGRRGRVF
jgi:hypothetical protein